MFTSVGHNLSYVGDSVLDLRYSGDTRTTVSALRLHICVVLAMTVVPASVAFCFWLLAACLVRVAFGVIRRGGRCLVFVVGLRLQLGHVFAAGDGQEPLQGLFLENLGL